MLNDFQGSGAETFYSLRVPSKNFPGSEVHPGPLKLVWEIPTETKILRVPFRFRDMPLL